MLAPAPGPRADEQVDGGRRLGRDGAGAEKQLHAQQGPHAARDDEQSEQREHEEVAMNLWADRHSAQPGLLQNANM